MLRLPSFLRLLSFLHERATPLLALAGWALATLLLHAPAWSAGATRDQARALVQQAVAFIQSEGPAKAYAEINRRDGRFVQGELYIVVYGMDGRCLAHGANLSQAGRDMLELSDVDGKYFVRERLALAASSPGGFWHSYKMPNPVSRRIESKTAFCQKLDATVVCSGVYG